MITMLAVWGRAVPADLQQGTPTLDELEQQLNQKKADEKSRTKAAAAERVRAANEKAASEAAEKTAAEKRKQDEAQEEERKKLAAAHADALLSQLQGQWHTKFGYPSTAKGQLMSTTYALAPFDGQVNIVESGEKSYSIDSATNGQATGTYRFFNHVITLGASSLSGYSNVCFYTKGRCVSSYASQWSLLYDVNARVTQKGALRVTLTNGRCQGDCGDTKRLDDEEFFVHFTSQFVAEIDDERFEKQ